MLLKNLFPRLINFKSLLNNSVYILHFIEYWIVFGSFKIFVTIRFKCCSLLCFKKTKKNIWETHHFVEFQLIQILNLRNVFFIEVFLCWETHGFFKITWMCYQNIKNKNITKYKSCNVLANVNDTVVRA